ncbi:MAG: glycosyltransferase [Bacteroidales bacterium]
MTVLSDYLSKHLYYPIRLNKIPSSNLGIVVVIPCYKEENITNILQSLYDCQRPNCDVEVIVVVNAPENADCLDIETNNLRIKDFYEWIENHHDPKLTFYLLNYDSLPTKDAGVGLARKLGMDEALHRFELIDNPDGVIVNIDADCTCSKNYLIAIEREFANKKTKACSIRFEHPYKGNDFPQENYDAIIQYELYLHYYILSLRKTGHPFAFHTIGSAFAVRASVYAMQGGMNKRKAGEDFYFLQKVIPLGGFTELNDACVYPSPRSSLRVPFGTGASIEKIIKSNKMIFTTYDLRAFEDLELFFKRVASFYTNGNYNDILIETEEPLKTFLLVHNFLNHMIEIQTNTATQKAFMLRFYRWFNAFMVLKYMNFSHKHYYQRKPIAEMAKFYLSKFEKIDATDYSNVELLLYFRRLMYGQRL